MMSQLRHSACHVDRQPTDDKDCLAMKGALAVPGEKALVVVQGLEYSQVRFHQTRSLGWVYLLRDFDKRRRIDFNVARVSTL